MEQWELIPLPGQKVQEIYDFNDWVRKITLEKGMAALSSILAWRIPWTEEAGGLPSPGCKESEHAHTYTIVLLSFLSAIIFLLSCFKYLHL